MNTMNHYQCPCGGTMIGDGYQVVHHCEFAEEEDYWYVEPDSEPVYCCFVEDEEVKEGGV